MKKLWLILPLAASMLLSSCNGKNTGGKDDNDGGETTSQTSGGDHTTSGGGGDDPTTQGDTLSVSVNPSSLDLDVYSNPTATLTATINPSNSGYSVKWRSTNTSIVTVDQEGHVTALAEDVNGGEQIYAFIDLDNDNKYDTNEPRGNCSVMVSDSSPIEPKITGIVFNGGKSLLDKGESTEIAAFVSGTDGRNEQGQTIEYSRKATFSTPNTDVIQLTPVADDPTQPKSASKVTVTALKGGSATLIATAVGDGTKTVSKTIEVLATVTSILSVTSKPDTILIGKDIDPSSVSLSVEFDDGTSTSSYAPERVEHDKTLAGPQLATAYIGELSIQFEITVVDGVEKKITFTNKEFDDSTHSFDLSTSKAGTGFESSSLARGIQVHGSGTAYATTKAEYTNILGFEVVCSTNNSNGEVKVEVGETSAFTVTLGGSMQNEVKATMLSSELNGNVKVTLKNTGSVSVWLKSISIIQRKEQIGIDVLTLGKTQYQCNEYFDITGYVVVPKYNTGLGSEQEKYAITDLDVLPEDKLVPENTSARISLKDNPSFYVDVVISVTEVLPTSLDVEIQDSSYNVYDESRQTFNLSIGNDYDFGVLIDIDEQASRPDIEFVSENACATYEAGTLYIDASLLSDEVFFTIEFRYVHAINVKVSFSVNVIDASTPHIASVWVDEIDTSIFQATQYAGEDFDYDGVTFIGNYTVGDPQAILGSSIVWDKLVEGQTPHGTYTEGKDVVDVYAMKSGSSICTVLANPLEITFTGELTKDTYELVDSWSIDGIIVSGAYKSGKSYDGGFTITFSPATPKLMGTGEDQDLTITAIAVDGTSKDKVVQVTVVGNQYVNTTELQQGKYFISYVDTNGTSHYLSGFSSGKGSSTTNRNSALEFTFKLVGDDSWQITNDNKYLTIGSTSTSLALSNDAVSLTITWSDQTAGTRLISGSSGRHIVWYTGSSDFRTYSSGGIPGMTLEAAAKVLSITRIEGSVTAKLNQAWNTSGISVFGMVEGEVNAQEITHLVSLTCNPTTATSASIYSVNVTAALTSDTSIRLENVAIEAHVVTSSIWNKVTSISIGSQVIITSVDYDAVLVGVNSSNIGVKDTFDDMTYEQAFVLTVVAGADADTFAFRTSGNKYLHYSGDTSNELYLSDDIASESSWNVSFDEETGNVNIANAVLTNRVIRYNSQSPRFCCYKGTQRAIQLYSR